ncbi:MAG: sugar phosphate isomerase/epimerase [Candidatus Abyssobacteria bacterium SURF_5]|uniref:Sugar phosphate isomerase/epimerase n=1 Tax=Abyssobacteria bacterium (strain SURF_5) TaxID=2093360 RepID=A0A3A4N449_ABYX5|nr:MAG: sugar phosphate isomerase/epimerase [Candidatus Abyssubacteria bacterium SURF_5]
MKLGVFTPLFFDLSVDETLDKIAALGIEMVEIGTGNYPGQAHCDIDELLANEKKLKEYHDKFAERSLQISGLSCQGNPLHPDTEFARNNHITWRKTVQLAQKLGVEVVNCFSGCPGDSDAARYPNWITCSWPRECLKILEWQWNEKVIPYWKEEAKFAKSHGIMKIAFEMHPAMVVYNPETLLKLRDAAGENIGANFDPSHLFWQGIDPVAAIRKLTGAIFHVHAKDTYIDRINCSENGVLDTKHYGEIGKRSWIFRTVGYGHDQKVWKDIVSALRTIGYDYVLSIEHEDVLASPEEGLKKAVAFLSGILFRDELPGGMWWA